MRADKSATWAVIVAMVAGAPQVALGQEVMPVGVAPLGSPTLGSPESVNVPPVPPGAAESAGVDTVTLRDGGVIRGTVAESFPGRHVIIVSAAGERYTLAWDQVADVRYGAQGTATPGNLPPAALPPPPMPGPGRPRLHIELTRDATVRLYEMTGTIMVASGSTLSTSSTASVSAARPVCMAPCDKVIDGTGGQSFFFGGDRMMPSRRFTLHGHEGDMTAVVKPGRAGVFVGGVMATSLSLAPLLSGLVFLTVQKPSMNQSPTSLRNIGGVMVGVGTGLLVSGILMIALGRTRVELYKKATGAAQRRSGPARM